LARLVALLASFACFLVPAAGAVFGGAPIDARSAPWAAAVLQRLPSGRGFLCSGTIIDATHVVTAAHCVFDNKGARARPETLRVKTGTENGLSAVAADPEQDRVVSAFRVHPAYSFDLRAVSDDVAVLELSEPLDLRGPYVRAVALPRLGSAFPGGREFLFAGFGAKVPGVKSDGVLSSASGTVSEQGACVNGVNPLVREANAIVLCAVAPGSGSCEADSGGGLVAPGSHELLGVLNGGQCAERGALESANVAAPEILRFIQGDDHPPAAPRVGATTFVRLNAAGPTLMCSSGGWSGSPRLSYAFVSTTNGHVLQQGAVTTYRLNGLPAGLVSCRVTATAAGGSAMLSSGPAAATSVALIPPFAPVAGRAGDTVTIRVGIRLEAPSPVSGRFGICVEPSEAVAGRACSTRTVHGRRSGLYPVAVNVHLGPKARPGLVRAAVSGYAGTTVQHGIVLIRVS
jgi:hypothetical protein